MAKGRRKRCKTVRDAVMAGTVAMAVTGKSDAFLAARHRLLNIVWTFHRTPMANPPPVTALREEVALETWLQNTDTASSLLVSTIATRKRFALVG